MFLEHIAEKVKKEISTKELRDLLEEVALRESKVKELDILFYGLLEIVEFIEQRQKIDKSMIERLTFIEKEMEKTKKKISELLNII